MRIVVTNENVHVSKDGFQACESKDLIRMSITYRSIYCTTVVLPSILYILYHPCLFNSRTRETVALKPSLNLDLHRSLLNLFFFKPFRSWNFWLWYLFRTWSFRIILLRVLIADTGVVLVFGPGRSRIKTVRPVTALARVCGRDMGAMDTNDAANCSDLLLMMEAMSRGATVAE